MNQYKYEDFSRCLFNPLEKNFFKKYERLKELSDNERMMRYVAAMYDYNSPLIKSYSDLRMRKQHAAMLAGYDLKKDEAELIELWEFKGEYTFSVVDKFLKEIMYNRLWYAVCAREQTVYEYAGRMLKPIGVDDEKKAMDAIALKSKLSNDMAEIEKLLEQDYNKLYGNDDELKKVATKRFTPEDQAVNV